MARTVEIAALAELLTGYRCVRSLDIEEAREGIANVLAPHRIDPLPHQASCRTVFNAAAVGSVSLCYLTYGAPVRVRIDPSPAGHDFGFGVLVPLTGGFFARSGWCDINSNQSAAAIFDSDNRDHIRVAPRAEMLIVQVNGVELQAQLARMLGRPPSSRLRLNPVLDMNTSPARSWLSTVHALCRDLDGPRGLSHPALQKPTEQLIMSQLLTAVSPSGNKDLVALAESTPLAAAPRVIRRADQLICDHAREALTVGDIAEAVGVSVRGLQQGFRQHLDTTPTARLLEARLAGARAELVASDPGCTTVAQVAHAWGFSHLGRFARAYRQTFNERPSHTLRY